MKRTIGMLLALSLTASVGMYAFAADEKHSGEQEVTTNVPSNKVKWELVVPANVTIPDGGYDERVSIGEVRINILKEKDSDPELADNQLIEAYLQYDGELGSDAGDTLDYELSPADAKYDENGTGEAYETLEKNKQIKIGEKTRRNESYDKSDAWVREEKWDDAQEGHYTGTITYSSRLIENKTGT